MANPSDKKSLIIITLVILLIVSSTYMISMFARGYQFNFKGGPSLQATGLLSATSKPKSASVYINDRLITATDDTINLTPDIYTVKIIKDGYLPWEKTVNIKKETVFQTDTQLFRSVPDLRPITLTGAINPSVSLDFTKIVYSVASASAAKDNGLYMIELTDSPILISRSTPKQISPNFPGVDWSKFVFKFSPDSREILATNPTTDVSYLLPTDQPITQRTLFDVTPRISLIESDWNNQTQQLIATKISLLPKEIQEIISTDSAQHIAFSSTDDKILYLSQKDGQLSDHIIPAPPAQSTQTQTRAITKGNYYIYDLKDDTNFLIASQDAISTPVWLPNSNSVIFVEDQIVKVLEYDNTNKQTLFAGNFDKNTVYPWSDGSRIVILTSPYSNAPENLYAISIR